MMNDFISREAVIKAVDDYTLTNCPKYMHDWATNLKRAILEDVKSDIDNIPAADVQPVKRGVWKEHTVCENRNNGATHIYEYFEDYMTCSNCWHSFNYCDNDTERFNYCPNCGALMQDE